jgi:hypothetical protein
MITCDLFGRLGNQMFQIATTVATALRNDVPYVFPTKSITPNKWPVYFSNFNDVPFSDQQYLFSKYEEPHFHFHPIPYEKGQKLLLHGYFQSEKYFIDYRKEIIDLFEPYEKRGHGIKVALHIRRGDYMSLPNHHPFIGIEYIKNALKLMSEKTGKHFELKIYSDDMDWVINELIDQIKEYEIYLCGHEPFYELMDMASADHHIISNSSFSWWAAWLNQNPEKIIIAPEKWFGSAITHNTKNLIPEKWIKI